VVPEHRGVSRGAQDGGVRCLDVVAELADLPGQGIDVEAVGPEPQPASGPVTDPFGSPLGPLVVAVRGDHLGDRAHMRS
jgi:hypothetical protein